MLPNLLVYPVILHKETVGGFSVEVPDIGWTQGDDPADALAMAQDLIGTALADEDTVPSATPFDKITVSAPDMKALVSIDLELFRRQHPVMVRKHVSIPDYLNDLGIEQGINFSKLLTEALHLRLDA